MRESYGHVYLEGYKPTIHAFVVRNTFMRNTRLIFDLK